MSYDQFVAAMRDDLVHGARRRRRHERRRTRVLAATPLVALLVAGALVWGKGDRRDDVVTNAGPSPAVIDACNALHDLNAARESIDLNAADDALVQFAMLAPASGDDELAELGPALPAAVPDEHDEDHDRWQAYIDDVRRAEDRCRALAAPGWVPTFVPAELGPEPRVALEDYGTVLEWLPFKADDLADPFPIRIAGRDLQPVPSARTATGSFVVSWSWSGRGVQSCFSIGSTTSIGYSCGGRPVLAADGLDTSGSIHGGAAASTGDRVSFVVVEVAGQRYVQRPAEQTVVVDPQGPVDFADTDTVTTRAYDADGTELACRTKLFGAKSDRAC